MECYQMMVSFMKGTTKLDILVRRYSLEALSYNYGLLIFKQRDLILANPDQNIQLRNYMKAKKKLPTFLELVEEKSKGVMPVYLKFAIAIFQAQGNSLEISETLLNFSSPSEYYDNLFNNCRDAFAIVEQLKTHIRQYRKDVTTPDKFPFHCITVDKCHTYNQIIKEILEGTLTSSLDYYLAYHCFSLTSVYYWVKESFLSSEEKQKCFDMINHFNSELSLILTNSQLDRTNLWNKELYIDRVVKGLQLLGENQKTIDQISDYYEQILAQTLYANRGRFHPNSFATADVMVRKCYHGESPSNFLGVTKYQQFLATQSAALPKQRSLGTQETQGSIPNY